MRATLIRERSCGKTPESGCWPEVRHIKDVDNKPQVLYWLRLGAGTPCCSTCISISSGNRIRRNCKRLKITTCMLQLGQITNSKTQKDQQPSCHFRGSPASAVSWAWFLHMLPPRGWQTTRPPLSPEPWTCPCPHPFKEPACRHPRRYPPPPWTESD